MLSIVMALIAATGATSGPDLGEKAKPIELPIERVMVFSDRARVTRSSSVNWSAGVQVVRAPDLPGAVMLDSIRVTTNGARVVRVETRPVERERWSIDQVDAWLATLEQQTDKITLASGKLENARNELALLGGLNAAPPVPEKDRLGKPTPPLTPDSWRGLQDRLSTRRSQARASERTLERELRELNIAYQLAQREVQARDLGGFSDHKLEVLIIVDGEGKAGPGILSVEYAVPGAFWKPAYDLFFDPDAGKVELKAAGLVSQASGEDWTNAKLLLSTAIPGLGIDMPALQTWTLGDDREYIPRPTARTAPRTTRPFVAPAAKPRIADLEREADRALLQTRSQQLLTMASSPPRTVVSTANEFGPGGLGAGVGRGSVGRKTVIDFEDDTIEGDLAIPDGSALESRRSARRPSSQPYPSPSPPPSAPMMISESSADSDYDAPSAFSDVGDAAGAFFTETGLDDMLTDKTPTRSRGMALRRGDAWRPQVFSDPMLPAVSAGGFDYVYEAPLPVTVPSQANQLRVPLAARSYDVTTFYEATPSLATTAYLKATVKNGSRLPILTGPANVFVKRTFSGDALLATTGPGGALELPLGADEDIRLTRTVIPATKSQGVLWGAEDVTDYTVKIEIGNYKKRALTIRVVDQLPKTNVEKIKVEILSAVPHSVKNADADGLLYWHVDVAAGATKTVTFAYRITRPKGWRLQ
ncbi:MAG: mucoidy inhibitor MuiA family protein [Deltaproteobacteria bacterium]|nr:mucoidy inhibitor MuiA family protein [Deltaproteobacteria bacterium]